MRPENWKHPFCRNLKSIQSCVGFAFECEQVHSPNCVVILCHSRGSYSYRSFFKLSFIERAHIRQRLFHCQLQRIHASRDVQRARRLRRLAQTGGLSLRRLAHFPTWWSHFVVGAALWTWWWSLAPSDFVVELWTCGLISEFGKSIGWKHCFCILNVSFGIESFCWETHCQGWCESWYADFVAPAALSEPQTAIFIAGLALCGPPSAERTTFMCMCVC